MMMGERLGERIGMREEVINRACSISMKAHKSTGNTGKQYLCEKIRGSSEVVFAFAGSWSAVDWFRRNPFGETKINLGLFPSLRSIGNDETAMVNEAFACRFEAILTQSFVTEVEKAKEKKQIVFAGHSSGGVMATLATLWFLEKWVRPDGKQMPPRCVTFGSPLAGDRIFSHALRRENWAPYFLHFVGRYDIVPRIMLTPLSSIENVLQPILHFFNPKSQYFNHEIIKRSSEATAFFVAVTRSASFVASHAACNLMGSTNLLLETISSFIELSPYRPFGKYIFCTGNGKLAVVENPDAVLQMLFYCLQLSSESEGPEVVDRSLSGHLGYENELRESLEMQNVVYLDNHLEELPLSSNGCASGEVAEINTVLNDLGLSARARLCLRAAGELEKQKLKNQKKIDSNENNIEKLLDAIQYYQTDYEARRVGCYDAFKLQKDIIDFNANVKRLELAGIWDEIIELLKRYELPDGFEVQKKWINLGTRFRRLTEPLDIANYYRHLKNEDTGAYLTRGRPKRYRFTQRWLEHYNMMTVGSSSESCFWANVEELSSSSSDNKSFQDMKGEILKLEGEVYEWVNKGVLHKDVFLEGSTFAKWWKKLPHQHRSESCLKDYMGS